MTAAPTLPEELLVDELPLEELHAMRRALVAECARATHWRRLVQARLDLAVAAVGAIDDLQPVARVEPPAGLNSVRLRALIADDIAACHLEPLAQTLRALDLYLEQARRAATRATDELVRRYCLEPDACLRMALPDAG